MTETTTGPACRACGATEKYVEYRHSIGRKILRCHPCKIRLKHQAEATRKDREFTPPPEPEPPVVTREMRIIMARERYMTLPPGVAKDAAFREFKKVWTE